MSADFLVNGQVQIASPSKQNLDRINRDIKSALKNIQANVRLGFDKQDIKAQLKQTLAGIKVELPIKVKADLGSLAKLQANINRQLAQISPTVYVKVKAQEVKGLAQGIDRGQVGKIVGANNSVVASNKKVVDSFDSIGRQIGIAIRRYGTFTVATTAFIKLTRSFGTAIKQAIDFDRELVRLAQVSNTTVANIRPIADEVRRLAVGMGASSEELIKASNTFLQAGLSLKDTKILLESLAKTTLSATFIDPENTKEAIIAIRQQFGIAVKDMDKVLSSINAVAAAFASESEDITTAVRRAGAAVKTSGATFDEFQASVVAVRQTTRESAETIATGLRTIALRLQRVKTQEFLRKFGIELLDTQGNFVGFVKAIDKLRQGLSGLAENSPEYAKIVEEVAGYRQVSKLLPLIQKYDVLLKAIQVSERGALSLTRDSMKAQDALSVQLNKVKEAYLELAFAVADNKGFRELVKVFSDLAVSLAAVGTSIAKSNLLPAIVALGGLSLLKSGVFTRLASGVMGGLKSATAGFPITRNSGGGVPGKGNTDTVPAMLTPGEYVLNKDMVSQVGTSALERWRKAGVPPQKLNFGGSVRQLSRKDKQIYERLTDANKVLKNKYGITTKDIVGDKIFVGKRKGFLGEYDSEFNAMFLDSNTGIDTIFEESFHGVDNILGGGNIYQWASHEQGTLPNKIASLFGQNKQDFAKTLGFDFKKHQQYFSNPMEMFAKPLAMRLSSPQKARKINNVSSSFDMYEGLYDERLTDLIHDKVKGFQKFNKGGRVKDYSKISFSGVTSLERVKKGVYRRPTRKQDKAFFEQYDDANSVFTNRLGLPLNKVVSQSKLLTSDENIKGIGGFFTSQPVFDEIDVTAQRKHHTEPTTISRKVVDANSIYVRNNITSKNKGVNTFLEEYLHALDKGAAPGKYYSSDRDDTFGQSGMSNIIRKFNKPKVIDSLIKDEGLDVSNLEHQQYLSDKSEIFAKITKKFLTSDRDSKSRRFMRKLEASNKGSIQSLIENLPLVTEDFALHNRIAKPKANLEGLNKLNILAPKGLKNTPFYNQNKNKNTLDKWYWKNTSDNKEIPQAMFGIGSLSLKNKRAATSVPKGFSASIDEEDDIYYHKPQETPLEIISAPPVKTNKNQYKQIAVPQELPNNSAFVPQPWYYDETGRYTTPIYAMGSKKYKDKYGIFTSHKHNVYKDKEGIFEGEEGSGYGVRPRKVAPIRIGSAGTWDGFQDPSMFRGIGETLPVDNPNPFGFGNSSSSGLSPETQELFGVRYGERHGRSLVAREKRHSKRSPFAGWYASSRRSFREELQAARERRLENKGKNPIGGSMSIARLLLTYGLLSSTGILPFNRGGQVPGKGNTDSVPAVLTPEEYVIRKEAVNKVGVDVLDKINQGQVEFNRAGRRPLKFMKGGPVPFDDTPLVGGQSEAAQNMGGMDKALIAMTALSFVTQSASDNLGQFGTSLVSTAIQLIALQSGIKESGLKEAFFDMADGALESSKKQRNAMSYLWKEGAGNKKGVKRVIGGAKSVAGGILAMGQKGVSNLTAGGGLKALTSLGPKLAKIAMPLSLIAGVAGDALASKGKADIASGKDGTGSIIAGRAASWGAIGATIGSVIPGVGTAVGGGIGATAGAVSGYFEGERLKKEYGVDTGLEKSQATLESFGKKTIDSAGALALLQKDIGKFTKELDSGLSEDYKSKIKAQFTGNLGAIEDVIAKESKKLNSVGEFDAKFKEFAMGLSILTDVPYENIRKGFVDEIEARAKVVASFKVFNDTLLRQAAISKAVGAASISVEQFGFRVERAFDSGSIQDTNINFESVFERISKGQSGDQDISRVLNLLNSTETTGQVGKEFQSVAGVLSNLDKAMSVASNVASGDIGGGDIADVIMSQFGDLDERTKASIGNALKDLIPSGGTEADLQATLQSDPTAIREAIANSVSKQMESIKDVTNLYNQQASALLSSVNAILDLNSKYKTASAEINELTFRQQGFDTDKFGDPLSGQAARDRAIAQDRLSLQTASGGMANPGVNTFRDVLSTSGSRIKEAEFALSNQSLDQQAREQAIATLEKERMARQNAIDGLTELAKDSRQLGVVQDMLAQKQRANAQTYNEGKIMASGTFDDKAQLQRAKKLAQKVAASGTLSGLSDDQRREALGYLEANSDREFVTQSGKISGAQLSKKLIAGDSANASIKDEILGQDTETKALEAQAKQLLEIQKKAAAALRDPIVSAYDEIKGEQERLQSDFYSKLTSIFDTYFNSGIDQEIETKEAEIRAVQDQKVRNQRTAQKYGLKESDIIDGSGIAAEGKQYLDRQKEIEKLEAAKKSVNFTGKSLEEQKATARRLAAEVGLDTLQPEKTILYKPGLYAEPAAKANAAAVQSALDVKINALKADQKLSYEELGKTKMGRNFRYSGINEGSIKEIQSISDPSSLTQKEKELNRSVQDLEKRRKKNEPGGTAGTNSGNSGVASTSGNNIPPNPVVPQKPIQDLANAVANIPSEISLGGQYQVNVNVTGLNGNGEFDAAIQRMIQPMIDSALQDFTKRNFPEGQLS